MQLKAGDYEIEFRFEPKSYDIGKILSIICSILLTTALGCIIFAVCKNKEVNKKNGHSTLCPYTLR
jgi:hypothetical protein